MLSKRANVFYLEHVRVMQMDNRIVYATQDGGEIESFFNLPERNTAFVLLGKGSSITDAAMRRMAEANVMIGFCGSGGSPLFGALDMAFMPPQSEYRPTEYMQSWMAKWLDDNERIAIGKKLLRERANYAEIQWSKNSELKKMVLLFLKHFANLFLKMLIALNQRNISCWLRRGGPKLFMLSLQNHSTSHSAVKKGKGPEQLVAMCVTVFSIMGTILHMAMLRLHCVGLE